MIEHRNLYRCLPAGFAVAYGLWTLVTVFRNKSRAQREPANHRWTTGLMFASLILVFLSAMAESAMRGGPPSGWLPWLGTLLIAVKVWVTRRCRKTLGPCFTHHLETRRPGDIVRTGPYRWCRHPLYSARLLATTGIPLAFGAPLVIAPALVVDVAILAMRIRAEEKVLLASAGRAYLRYRGEVGAVIPRPQVFFGRSHR